MKIQDKAKLDTLIIMNQVLSKINSNSENLNSEIEFNQIHKLEDKKISNKILQLNELMKKAAELSKEIENNFYAF